MPSLFGELDAETWFWAAKSAQFLVFLNGGRITKVSLWQNTGTPRQNPVANCPPRAVNKPLTVCVQGFLVVETGILDDYSERIAKNSIFLRRIPVVSLKILLVCNKCLQKRSQSATQTGVCMNCTEKQAIL
ncbi:MAG: hypothetical protein MUD08_12260 [Cytophagales bacterium]|nr:hypothetical protein [Cytophagales bacterium]